MSARKTKRYFVVGLILFAFAVGVRVWDMQLTEQSKRMVLPAINLLTSSALACDKTQEKQERQGQIPSFSIKVGKTQIKIEESKLVVNGTKVEEGKTVVQGLRIGLNVKHVLSVDNDRDVLLVYTTNKPLPKPDKKVEIKIGKRIAYAGRWLALGEGKARKVVYLIKLGFWRIQISQMQDKKSAKTDKTAPEMFKQAVSTFQLEGAK